MADTDYYTFTVDQLREKLSTMKMDSTGKKDVLIARLEGKDEFAVFTVPELRLKLRRLGLDSTGNKAELTARLNEWKNEDDDDDEPEEKENKKPASSENIKKDEKKAEKKEEPKKQAKQEPVAEEPKKAKEVAKVVEEAPKPAEAPKVAEAKPEAEPVDDSEANIKAIKKRITLVKHHGSLTYVSAYQKLLNEFKKVSGDLAFCIPPWRQFSMTVLALDGMHYRVLLERYEDTPVGAIWVHKPNAKVNSSKWFGEISDGWYGGTRDEENPDNADIVEAIEGWFGDNEKKVPAKMSSYGGYGCGYAS